MLSKSAYAKLGPKDKAKVKAMSTRLTGRGDYRKVSKVTGRRRVIRGHGDYWTGPGQKRTDDWKDSALARAGGSVFGTPGKLIGGALQGLFKKLTGYGDYKVNSNTFMTGNDPPLFASKGRGMVVQHREFLGDITTSSVASQFNIQTFPINAAQPTTFPWLSQVASQFEQFCVRGMIFEFKSMSSDALNSTNTALGSVIMATQYNSVNAPFTNKSQMENHEFSSSCKSSADFIHGIECARGETPVNCLYTRLGSVPVNADPRLYDLGQFNIATVGFQGTSVNIGELWVTYDIELLKPQLQSSGISTPIADHWLLTGAVSATPFGTVSPVLKSGSTGTSCLVNATWPNGILQFPVSTVPQQYLISYSATGTNAVLTNQITPAFSTGVTAYNYFNNNTGQIVRQTAGPTANVQFFLQAITVAANTASANMSIGLVATFPAASNYADLIVIQLPSPSLFNENKRIEESKLPRYQLMSSDDLADEKELESERQEQEEFLEYLRFKASLKKKEETKEPDYQVVSEPSTPSLKLSSRK